MRSNGFYLLSGKANFIWSLKINLLRASKVTILKASPVSQVSDGNFMNSDQGMANFTKLDFFNDCITVKTKVFVLFVQNLSLE